MRFSQELRPYKPVVSLMIYWFFFLIPLGVFALDPGKSISQYSIRIWNMESGLPGNSIFALCQTGDGYLWIGTQDGLVRFDGMRFEIYNKRNTPQLMCNVIRSLYVDRDGGLWIGTATGGLVHYKDSGFEHFPISLCRALSGISCIGQDSEGTIWIGSFSKGLARFEKDNFSLFTSEQGLPCDRVRSIGRGPSGNLLIATQNGIVQIDHSGNITRGQPSTHNFSDSITTSLFDKVTTYSWIGTVSNGLQGWSQHSTVKYNTTNGLPHPTVTSLLMDRKWNLWIGTDGGGITRLTNGGMNTLGGGEGLACGFVYSLLEDREGSIWVGTLDGGLHQFRDSKFSTFTTQEGLTHDSVNCVFQDSDGITWVGAKNGLNRYDGASLSRQESFNSKAVMCLCQGHDNTVWVGTWDGLYRAPGGNMSQIRRVTGLRDQRVRCLAAAPNDSIWIGTENGLCHYRDGIVDWLDTGDGLRGNSIQFIHIDRNNTVWISSDKGIDSIRGRKISPWKPAIDQKFQFAYCVHEDSDGTCWLGTDSGLIRCSGEQTAIFTDRIGLVDNHIYSILEDNDQHLWLAGRNGISRVSKRQFSDFSNGEIPRLSPVSFNEKHGMKSRWCTGNACVTRDGRFWFPTSVGVSVINPDHIKKNHLPPTLVIEKFLANGEAITHSNPLSSVSPIELSPGKKRLEFHYTAISFINPQQITFKIRLKGYDSSWLNMGTTRSTTYIGLPPGDYIFEVMATNPDGIGNPVAVSLPFRLRPFFYQTSWFFATIFMFILLLAILLYRFRIRQLRLHQKKLKNLVEVRTQELRHSKDLIEAKNSQLEIQSEQLKDLDEAKSRFFANISHEFRTPLTLIMGPLEQLIADYPDKQVKTKANLMLRNSRRLLGLVNQLLELARIDSGRTRLEATIQDIVPFLKNIVDCFDPLAQQQQSPLSFHSSEVEIELPFDLEKMEKVMSNLLSNAFRHTPSGGKISVLVRRIEMASDLPEAMVEIVVRDNGTGISPGELPHIFDRFYRGQASSRHGSTGSGIGLSLSKELVELHGGSISVGSDNSDGPDRGTEFSIILPTADIQSETKERKEPEHNIAHLPVEERERPLILVVEDNKDMRHYIKASLKSSFEVAEATDGRQGILRAKQLLPDLILSDIMMPHTDGYTLCRTLKNDILTSHIPIILLTAKTDESNIIKGFDAGADDYLTKPFNAAQLRQRGENLILLRQQYQWEKKNRLSLKPEKLQESSIDDAFFDTLQETIESHLTDSDFNVDALSKLLGMSQSTLYRKIQGITGQTPNQFIRSFRIKRAARLLEANTGSISDVAAKVGFSDKSYFAKCFKEEFQCAPSSFKDISDNETSRAANTQAGDKTKQNRKIVLVVEDDPDTRQYIRDSLKVEFEVLEAVNGDEGFTVAVKSIPDIIISDVMMPKTDGFKLCYLLKSTVQTSHIPVILLTARASEESKLKGLESKADDYITKPFNTNILISRISNLIRLRHHLQEKRKRRMLNLPHTIKESGIDRAFIGELDTIIKKNLADSTFNVTQLARKLYMSETSLYRKVSTLTGQNPSGYIRSFRLKQAAEQLKHNNASITDIAFAVGFNSQAYFTRCFKEQFHQLPSTYKASISH